MHFFENSACFSYLSVVGWLYKMRKDTNTMNTDKNVDIKKRVDLDGPKPLTKIVESNAVKN